MDMVVKNVSWTTPTVVAKYVHVRVRVKSDLNDGVASQLYVATMRTRRCGSPKLETFS